MFGRKGHQDPSRMGRPLQASWGERQFPWSIRGQADVMGSYRIPGDWPSREGEYGPGPDSAEFREFLERIAVEEAVSGGYLDGFDLDGGRRPALAECMPRGLRYYRRG
jgi:hypothetical protein